MSTHFMNYTSKTLPQLNFVHEKKESKRKLALCSSFLAASFNGLNHLGLYCLGVVVLGSWVLYLGV